MTVRNLQRDPEALTLTITNDFDAPVERVWQMWADPRRLERWWGPPTFPATFVDHDLVAGGRASYYMTSPEGERHYGWWRIVGVDEPRRLEIEDGFADSEGTPNPDLPTTMMHVDIEADAGRTRMVITTTFPSREAMEQMVSMGMEEGMSLALGQIDDLLTADAGSP